MATIAATSIDLDICPNCGQEWPFRFGHHACNFHRAYIHNNSVVVEPHTPMADAVAQLAARQERDVCRSAEYADLGGNDSPYPDTLRDIDAAIGRLKRHRQVVQELAWHTHQWDGGDYCVTCGADGRA